MTAKSKKTDEVEQVPYGESGGKFFWSTKVRDVSKIDLDGAAELNAPSVELHATNNGWLVTGDTKLVDQVDDEDGPGAVLVFAAPVERNGDAPRNAAKRTFGKADERTPLRGV